MGCMSEMARYHRQMLLRGIGEAGQEKLLGSRAVVVGCGALGTVAAELLARAGVGTVVIVDRDVVELTNLQRQVLFDEKDAREGLPKAEAAARKLMTINSGVRVEAVVADFGHRNAEKLTTGAGVILDGTDNFETRYLLNDVAVKAGVPLVYAGAVGTEGMSFTVLPGEGACLRCVFEEPPDAGSAATCDTAGVLGPVTSMIASVQTAEALKVLLGKRGDVGRALVAVDLWANTWRRVDLKDARREDCLCCVQRRFEFLDGERATSAAKLCGRGSVQVNPPTVGARVDLDQLAQRLRPHARVEVTRFMLRGVLGNEKGEEGGLVELTVFPDGRAIVKGTTVVERAKGIYAKYVGA